MTAGRNSEYLSASSFFAIVGGYKALIQPSYHPQKQWLRSTEVRKMFGISHGTLQNLRIRNVLPYQKVGGIIFYKYADIVSLLEKGPDLRE